MASLLFAGISSTAEISDRQVTERGVLRTRHPVFVSLWHTL
jgi:hypothetical protein